MTTQAGRNRYVLRRERGRPLDVVTPEGIALRLTGALAGDRLGAFFIDMFLIYLFLFLLIGLFALAGGEFGTWEGAVLLIGAFLLQNFYFIWFETRHQGTTPGKRRVGIRVIDRAGGELTTDAVIVRNLVRILEVNLPLAALLAPDQFWWADSPWWVQVLSALWLLAFAGMPLFNRQRLRIGDMVAGTTVVLAPQTLLLPDPSAKLAAQSTREGAEFTFTSEQLGVYGIYELQVLEELLRRRRSRETDSALRAVAARIRKKIRYREKIPHRDTETFLREFYAAMRAHHEHRLLLGKRKEDKFSAES